MKRFVIIFSVLLFVSVEPARSQELNGVLVGPVANLPATCSVGLAYWAIDEGEWWSDQAGADGRLYKCTATNVWTPFYIPYAYPHFPPGPDVTAPIPGNAGIITVSNIGQTSLTLTWTKATDNTSSQAVLQYEVRRSSSNNIDAVARAEANGTVVMPFAADVGTVNVTGLSPNSTTFFNVIVRDQAGNKAAYVMRSATTLAGLDVTAPTPGNSGTINTSNVVSTSLTLSWTRATDDVSPQSALQYEVRRSISNNISTVATAEANGMVVLPYTANIAAVNVTGLSPSVTYFFNIIVKDQAGNKAAYVATNATTTTPVLRIETLANGTGVPVGSRNVASGTSITVFAIQREVSGTFIGNVSAAWSLTGITGGVVSGDVVPAGDNKSAVFTGHGLGSATVTATLGSQTASTGTLTVVAGAPASVRVETSPTGNGSVVPSQDVAAGSSLTVFAIQRDISGNFIANTPASWFLSNVTGGVLNSDLVPSADARSAVFTGHALGSARVTATAGSLGSSSGTLTVTPGLVGNLRIETAANGTGTQVGVQNLQSGSSVTGYAIQRDTAGNFISNVASTWFLTNISGGVVNTDLVASGDRRSAVFTGRLIGSATWMATAGGLTSNPVPVNVSAGPPASVRVENAPDGSGSVVGAQNVQTNSSVTGFAIQRDSSNNFVANATSAWSLTNITGSVVAADLVPSADNRSAVFTGHLAGSARMTASVGGQSGSSGILTVTDTVAPTVSITTPLGGTVSGPVTVAATANDNVGVVGVQFQRDGVNVGAEDNTAPYSIVWDTTNVSNGSHTLSAIARDAAGNLAMAPPVTVNVNNAGTDTVPPLVIITAPPDGSAVAGSNVTITAAASDNVGVVGIQFSVDGVNLGAEDTSVPYSILWDTTALPNAVHTLRAVARDPAGNQSTSEISVTVSNAAATITYNIPPNGGVSLVTTETTANELSISHARFEQATGPDSALTGVAIIGFRQGGVLVTESGVPGLPPMTSGRIYAEIRGPATTGIALSNPGPQDAQISFYFTDGFGTDFGFGSMTLSARTQVAAYLDKFPFYGPIDFQGTFTFISSIPIGAVALRGFTNQRSEFLITAVPVSPLGAGKTAAVLPQFADGNGWTTQVMLTNASDAVESGIIQFFGQQPQTSGSAIQMSVNGLPEASTIYYWLPARTSASLATAGGNPVVQVGSVRVTGSVNIQNPSTVETPVTAAVLSLRNQFGVTVSEAGVSAVSEGSAFRMYMEASGVAQQIGSVQSGIAVANTAAGEVTVSVELTNLQGTPLGLPAATLTVPAGGQVTKFINELFPGLAGNFRGIARLTASSYVAVVALRGRYNERGDFLITTTPPLNETAGSSADVIFPHIVNGAGYTTQLTIFGDPGAGRVYLFGQDGTPKSSSSLTLQQ